MQKKRLVLIGNIKLKSLLDPKQSWLVIVVIQCEISNNIQRLPRKKRKVILIQWPKKKIKSWCKGLDFIEIIEMSCMQ